MTTIYLIRHGEAEGNLYRRAQGIYNSNLTPHGYKQLEKLQERFQDIHVDLVYASDLTRAYLTAKSVADIKNLPVIKSENLREINMGIMEDIPWGDLPRLYPDLAEMWEMKPHICDIPNGESPYSSGKRLYDEIVRISRENQGKSIVIGTHGAVIRSALHIIKDIPMSEREAIAWCDNTAVTKLVLDDNFNISIEFESDNTHLGDFKSEFLKKSWWEYTKEDKLPNFNLWFEPVTTDDFDIAFEYAKMCEENISFEEFCKTCGKISEQNENQLVFVYSDDELCGFIGFEVYETFAEIMYFTVKENYRGKGLTPPLMGHIVSYARKNNKKMIKSHSNNRNMVSYLKKIGFQEENNEMVLDISVVSV